MKSYALSFLLFFVISSCYSQYFQRQIISQKTTGRNTVGTEIDIDGNTLLLSDPRNDIAYIFKLTDGLWELEQELTPSDATGDKNFGVQMSIDGDDIIIGANSDDDDLGAAYFFHRGTDGLWEEMSKILAPYLPNRSSDPYWGGSHVNMKNGIATTGRNNGLNKQFHVSRRNEDFTWSLTDTLFTPSFISGRDLYLSDSLIAIPSRSGFQLYIFDLLPSGEWSEVNVISLETTDGVETFGRITSGEGNLILVNSYEDDLYIGDDTIVDAGSIHVFEKIDGEWINNNRLTAEQPEAYDYFGIGFAIENNTVVVGAEGHDFGFNRSDSLSTSGTVYVFENQNNEWDLTQKLVASVRATGQEFGRSIAMSNEIVSIGSDGGGVYIFNKGNDCLGLENGGAYYDVCSFCVGGTSGFVQNSSTDNCILTGINNLIINDLVITPNPFSDSGIQIESSKVISNVSLYDLTGQLFIDGKLGDINASVKSLTEGVYMIHVLFEDGSIEVEKLIKE